MSKKPIIICDPYPRTLDLIFSKEKFSKLKKNLRGTYMTIIHTSNDLNVLKIISEKITLSHSQQHKLCFVRWRRKGKHMNIANTGKPACPKVPCKKQTL